MSKLDHILDYAIRCIDDHTKAEAKDDIKALFLELITSIDKDPEKSDSSHKLAELTGRKDAIIELYQKVSKL